MIDNLYLWLKALHIISFTAWMAGMFYLPRLFVYHTETVIGTEEDVRFQTMERRLLRAIMLPAMIATFIFGLWLIAVAYAPGFAQAGWLHAKITLVLILAGLHGYFSVCRKKFARGENLKSAKYYKILNEVPTVLFVLIVILAIVKPF
jgi:putative membrane protein